ncbi:monocyte chemotactic protein 1B [Carassius carassius]|uniref:monocyte chemotactic protein 1B n=1 Tax=Carassius carassius TaxID=217509 RepID=UPI00286872E4|nr:monocyte chemotactic protein 1B [Carassius carassius]
MKSQMLGFHAVLLLWLLVSPSAQEYNVNLSGCLTTSNTKVPQRNLVSYKHQHKPLFPVDAVRFLTIRDKVICSDPSSPWAKKSMKYLDAKNKPQPVSNNAARQSSTKVPVKTSTTNKTRLLAQI